MAVDNGAIPHLKENNVTARRHACRIQTPRVPGGGRGLSIARRRNRRIRRRMRRKGGQGIVSKVDVPRHEMAVHYSPDCKILTVAAAVNMDVECRRTRHCAWRGVVQLNP